MKTLSPAFDQALRASHVRRAYLAEINHPGGTVYLWSGIGDLVWNSNTFKGLGRMGRISGVGETNEVRVAEQTWSLIVPEIDDPDDVSVLDDLVSQVIRGRLGKLWVALFNQFNQIIDDPVQIAETVFDNQGLDVPEDGAARIVLNGTSAIFDVRRAANVALTNEQQQADYSGDTGFDRIPTEVAQKAVRWTDS